jgi:hypothetical protein
MVIFDKNIFDPNIFQTDAESSSDGTESSVVEKKKGRSRGRSKGFLWRPVKKDRKVFIGFESVKTAPIKSFRFAPVREQLKVASVRLDDLDSESLLKEAKEQLLSAASKTADIKTVKKTLDVVSMGRKARLLRS